MHPVVLGLSVFTQPGALSLEPGPSGCSNISVITNIEPNV